MTPTERLALGAVETLGAATVKAVGERMQIEDRAAHRLLHSLQMSGEIESSSEAVAGSPPRKVYRVRGQAE